MGDARKGTMSTWGAAFLGIGSMVGAGVFALLGQAGSIAGAAVWISFLLGGIVAALLGYVVVKLGVRYPSSGGAVAYLNEGFGDSHLTGFSSWMYYFAVLIITAMVAVSFGSYGASLLFGEGAPAYWVNILATAVVLLMGLVSVIGTKLIARVQSVIVIVLFAVFAVFIVATLTQLQPGYLSPANYPPIREIMPSVALTFFAYIGFTVVTFTAGDLGEPAKQLPRAMFYALGLTVALYILLSFGVFGSLTVEEVIANGETALAVAAVPALGQAGFTMMAIAALLATASSVNANIYGAANVTRSLAVQGQFPPIFGADLKRGGTKGLLITLAAILVLANVFDLSAIADMGSAIALGLFILLSLAAYRLRAETGTGVPIIVVAGAATAIVLLVFLVDLFNNDPATLGWLAVFAILALIIEFAWKSVRSHTSASTGRPVSS